MIKRIADLFRQKSKFRCADCAVRFKLTNRQMEIAQKYDGPYCPKCGKKVKSDSAGKQ